MFSRPLDIFPESIIGFLGLFDDIFVIFCAALYVTIVYRQFLSHS